MRKEQRQRLQCPPCPPSAYHHRLQAPYGVRRRKGRSSSEFFPRRKVSVARVSRRRSAGEGGMWKHKSPSKLGAGTAQKNLRFGRRGFREAPPNQPNHRHFMFWAEKGLLRHLVCSSCCGRHRPLKLATRPRGRPGSAPNECRPGPAGRRRRRPGWWVIVAFFLLSSSLCCRG